MEQNNTSNIPLSISSKIGKNLHNKKNHPIEIIKQIIYGYFDLLNKYKFQKFDNFQPSVHVEDNFDKLLIPKNHPSRSKSDTYYVDENHVLRTHTSAHQNELLSKGIQSFLVTGDVYRKDEIDKSHYPVFHQMEGVSIVDDNDDAEKELKSIMSGLIEHLFPGKKYIIRDHKFPFTEPSFEIDVDMGNKLLEVLGCGVVHKEIMKNNNLENKKAYAFGLGLDRLAMVLFDIPDIRYLWLDDSKFLSQFDSGKIVKFTPFSNLDKVTKDISFYIDNNDLIENKSDAENDPDKKEITWTKENSFFDLLRSVADDSLENVERFDIFYNKKKNKMSLAYRMTISPLSNMNNMADLTNYANDFMIKLQKIIVENNDELCVEPRF
jgi:phenylalanyl-tRNA synthetase alpha chain